MGGTRGYGEAWRWGALLLLAALTGCTRARTQLVVAVDTDLPWGPGEVLRSVQLTVRSNDPEGQLRDRRVVQLGAAVPLPASFGVVPLDDDASRRVWIEVRGCGERGCEQPLVTRVAYVGFVEGQTLLLRLTLAGACQGRECTDPTQTCQAATGMCESARVEASTLPAWTGVVPRMTGDVPTVVDVGSDVGDAAMDVSDAQSKSDAADSAEEPLVDDSGVVDAGVMDDLGGPRDVPVDLGVDIGCMVMCGGACTDLQRDALNCGSCGRACSTARTNSISVCAAGTCEVRCAEGYGDCDGNVANGCEVATTASAAHCGGCGRACPARANAGAACSEGACGFTCGAGFADCDGDGSNGCEVATTTSATHCGACGNVCRVANAVAACVAGACAMGACAAGFADCDRAAASGCEQDVRGDVANCGGCGITCRPANATGTCVAGSCGVGACAAGYGDCDGNPANGCETDMRTSVAHCGRCGVACAAGDYCVASSCQTPMLRHVFSTGVSVSSGFVVPSQVGLDAAGNIYWGGTVDGSTPIDFGAGPVVGNFVVSYTRLGRLRWIRVLTGSDQPSTSSGMYFSIGVSAVGQVIVAVHGANLDLGVGVRSGTGTHLASFNSDGVPQWARYIGTGNGALVEVDDAGNIAIFGSNGRWDLGGGSIEWNVLALLDPMGRQRWSRAFNYSAVITIAPRDESVCAFRYSTTRPTLTCWGASGALVFSTEYIASDSYRLGVPSISSGKEGRVTIVSPFGGTIDFGGGLLGESTYRTIHAVQFDRMGTHRWSRAWRYERISGSPSGTYGSSSSSDTDGNVYIGGTTVEAVSFGSGIVSARSTFITSINENGVGRWTTTVGPQINASSALADITSRNTDVAVIAWPFEGGLNFGGGPVGGRFGLSVGWFIQ